MSIYFIDAILNTEDRTRLGKKITSDERNEKKIVYVNTEALNITQFISTALRCCRKLESQRIMILPIDFQRQAIQLNIAKQNKQNYEVFEATTAEVFDVWRAMFCDHEPHSKKNAELSELVDAHRRSLQAAGLLDHFNISQILNDDILAKGKIFEKLQDLILIVEDVEKFSAIDLRLLKVLCTQMECRKVTTLNANRSLDISGIGELLEDTEGDVSQQLSFEVTHIDTKSLFENIYDDGTIFISKEKEIKKRRLEQIFISYLRLLINSKDEFALALILNLPDRDISPKTFALIQKAAASKNMPAYQAIMSTVMRHRLGGKGYQPKKECPIVQHLKPLSLFMDFMMKLQDLIEEESDPLKCALKILSKIKAASITLVKAHQMEHAYTEMQHNLKKSIEADWTAVWGEININEEQSSSCALQTLRTNSGYNATLKVLQHLCDAEAGKNTHFYINNYDFDSSRPQNTPRSHLKGSPQLELPSLVHMYKSPATAKKDGKFGEDSTPLINRLQKNNSALKSKPKDECAKRMRSHMDWVGEEVSPASNKSPVTPGVFSPIVGPTLKAVGCRAAESKPPPNDWKDTLQVINQNIADRQTEEKSVPPTNKRKRALITDISNLPLQAKSKKPDPMTSKQEPEAKSMKIDLPASKQEPQAKSRKTDPLASKQEPEAKPGKTDPPASKQQPTTKRKKAAKDLKQIKGQQSIMKFFS